LSGLSTFQVSVTFASGDSVTGPPLVTIASPEGDWLPFCFLALELASTSVSVARRLSVRNGTETSRKTASLSRLQRARTCRKRPGGLETTAGLAKPWLHGLQESSGSLVLPVRVENSSAAFETHESLPNLARMPASSTLLVQTESVPPTPLIGCSTAGSLPATHCCFPLK
jgi:hypothetical protein